MSDINIFHILIGSGTKPLAEYSPFQTELIKECEKQLSHCTQGSSAITKTDYKIYYLNENNITYMIMTNTNYPMPAAVACLESMKKEYGNILNGRNFSKLNNYGLNSEFKEKLKMKYEYYNENTDIVDEELEKLKDGLRKKRD